MADAVECPKCSSLKSRVVDSRPSEIPIPHVHRRRRCVLCGERYSTREFLDNVYFPNFIDANGLSERERDVVRVLVAKLREKGEE